jgi:hypothetical protein
MYYNLSEMYTGQALQSARLVIRKQINALQPFMFHYPSVLISIAVVVLARPKAWPDRVK